MDTPKRNVEQEHVVLVTESFHRCCRSLEFFDEFYDNLCNKCSEIGPMFAHTDMERQNILIRTGIDNLLLFANGSDAAQDKIVELGRLHARAGLNVRPELYRYWVEALLQAIREHDPEWDDSLEPFWRELLQPGIEQMILLY